MFCGERFMFGYVGFGFGEVLFDVGVSYIDRYYYKVKRKDEMFVERWKMQGFVILSH